MWPRLIWLAVGLAAPTLIKWVWDQILELPSYQEDIKQKQRGDALRWRKEADALRDYAAGIMKGTPEFSAEAVALLDEDEVAKLNVRLGAEIKGGGGGCSHVGD